MSLHIEISISSDDLRQAAENLVYELESNFPHCVPDEDAIAPWAVASPIASLIKNRLESVIEQFISCPESHLDSFTLSQVESCFRMPGSFYKTVEVEF